MKRKRITIMGAGQLGSRHLQGLAQARTPLSITVLDRSPDALAIARARWEEAEGSAKGHEVSYGGRPPPDSDLAIVATTAHQRDKVVESLAKLTNVGLWIIEKPLAQAPAQLDRLAAILGELAVVNTARRTMHWHNLIATALQGHGPFEVLVEGGGWGLACNAIHHLDLVRWWSGEEPAEIDISGLKREWIEAKRKGFSEVLGRVVVDFSGGSRLTMVCHEERAPLIHLIRTGDGRQARLSEAEKVFEGLEAEVIAGRTEFQSEMTGSIADAVLAGQRVGLPSFTPIASAERLLLKALIPHRAKSGGNGIYLDIT